MTITVFASPWSSPSQRGRTLGAAWAGDITVSWDGYLRLFDAYGIASTAVRDVGERTLDAVAGWCPPLADEIVGIAAGAGLEPWQAAALNARTEVLARYRPATMGECSTSVYLPADDAPRTIQTWDWYAHLRGVKLVWQLQPSPGRTVKTFTEFGVLGKIGVTDTGIGVHFNLLQHDSDGVGEGVPVHLVARRILDDAVDIEHAEQIVRSAEVSASSAITVVSYRDGRSAAATFELSPAGTAVLPANDGALFHTNHFLDPKLAVGERLGPIDADTYARQRELAAGRAGLRSADIGERAGALLMHRTDGAALCCHPEPDAPLGARWETMLVVGLDVEHGRLELRDGKPCDPDRDTWIRV